MSTAWYFFLLFISKCTVCVSQGGLEVEVLSVGGSWQDEVMHLAADGPHQYIVGKFNGGNQDFPGGPHETISVAKVGKNLTDWQGIHGHLSCDREGKINKLNCTQILDNRELIMSSVTGLVAINGDAILSGCYRSFFDKPEAGCASVVNPGKWRVVGLSDTCVNMQGGLTVHSGNVFVAGLFHTRVEFVQINDETGKNISFGRPQNADGLGAFFLEIDPTTGLIQTFGKPPRQVALGPLFIAAGPRDAHVYILSRRLVNTRTSRPLSCPMERNGGDFPSIGVVLTPLGFQGEGLFFDTDDEFDEFEPTGMVVDPEDPTVVYVSGYFKGVLRLSKDYELVSAPRLDPSQKSIDGILMKIEFNNKTVPSIDWVLRIGGAGEDKALGVAAKDGNVYVMGTFEFGLDVDGWLTRKNHKGEPLLLKVELNMETIESRGKLDIYVLKLLSGGMDVQWLSTAGGELDDFVTSIDVGADGDVHVGGRFSGVALFPGQKMLVSQGMFDAFVATYKELSEGVAGGSKKAPGSSGPDMWRVSCAVILSAICVCLVLAAVLYLKRKRSQKKKMCRQKQELQQNSGLLGKHRLRVMTEVVDCRSSDDGSG
ncbi:hypothetical protein BSKO_11215 [Bryopsis sp. KO-2023]|nr:hypothetical protein BSKO_11215 [Bryopsis sp. KO-2023]